ncbi:MAG TPA: hypothetical protein VM534_04620, partial [Thermoanaerobaculia bacterium]|nr:hypothetical protein [Thermoanaerobaculia bacterium]
TSADQQEAVSFQVQQAALSNSTESLRMLAEMTGGIATVGTNNFAGGFERLEQDLESYYSLGYRSGTQRVDRRRAIEVRTRNRSYQVRHRRSFVEKSIDSEMADRVMANLFHQNDRNDLGIFFTHSAGRDLGDGTFQVPIEIHIPVRNLTIFPHDDIHRGSFSIWVMAADPRGDMSEVQKQDHTVTFTSEQMEQMKNREYIYAVTLILRGGRNTVSIGVLDQLSKQTGFKRQDLLAMSR